MEVDRTERASDQDRHDAVDGTALLDAIKGLGDQLGRRIGLLQTTFERELRAEATRERVVDRLHAELQDYKQDFLLKVQRPIFIDLIQLHDDIGKMIDARNHVRRGKAIDRRIFAGFSNRFRPRSKTSFTARGSSLSRSTGRNSILASSERSPRRRRTIRSSTSGLPHGYERAFVPARSSSAPRSSRFSRFVSPAGRK